MSPTYTYRAVLAGCSDCGASRSPKAQRCRSCAQRYRWEVNGTNDVRLTQLHDYHGGRTGDRPYEDREWFRSRYPVHVAGALIEAGHGVAVAP